MPHDVHKTEAILVVVLLQLIIIILAARAAGALAAHLKQPRAVGEIVAGLALGPSLFGWIAPEVSAFVFTPVASDSMRVLSQIGLILLMFQIGSDFEFSRLSDKRNARAVTFVTVSSLFAPLLAGFAMGQITASILAPAIDPLAYSLFTAVALAITAVPILGRILKEFSLTRSDPGVIAISAAAMNDVCGWFLLAGIAAYASAAFAPGDLALRAFLLLALLAAMRAFGPRLVKFLLARFPVGAEGAPTPLMAIVLALIFAAGLATEELGIFTIFGGFLVGLLFHKEHAFVEAWRRQVGTFVLVFFLPIFFTYTGLRTNVLGLDSWSDWGWCAAFFAVSVGAKIIPVYFAARAAGVSSHDAKMIGVLMNTRALMELIVLNIGLNLGVLPPDVFTMLVIMAVGTTIMTGPLVQHLLARKGAPVTARVEA
jgi:Kef-type K+ transport system membrane component KefB